MNRWKNSELEFVPMQSFICKVASRCNLNCDYCYVYNHVDQSWRDQPIKMSIETATHLGKRIYEHINEHDIDSVDIVFHGGEPFLLTLDYLDKICFSIKNSLCEKTVNFRVQTNGTIFDQDTLDFCLKWKMTVGLSLDGAPKHNDRHRFDHKGKSLTSNVEKTLELLTSNLGRTIWSGFLTVIDLKNDPLEVYDYLKKFQPKSIELLFPLGNYEYLPPGKEIDIGNTVYADWLLKIFYVWFEENPSLIKIRRFRDVIALMLGSSFSSEEWGLQPVDFAVIESNGEIQAVDTLKVTYPDATNLGLNIFENSFDDMYNSQIIIERQKKWANLCNTCTNCNYVHICGGGYFPHRYSKINGFKNPSVYCSDLKKLIHNIFNKVTY